MERKYIIYHNGIKVDVVEAKTDATHDVQISVLGDPAFTRKPFGEYRDTQLEAEGWTKLSAVNGSLFFSENGMVFANGIEKSMGVVHENDDPSWDNNFAMYHQEGIPYFFRQWHIKTLINRPEIRGAITGAFGLLTNGITNISGGRRGEPNRGIYLARSGRTIIGKKADNTLVFATFDGVTGQSGLTGFETVALARALGIRSGMCMDGGGSTYLEYKGTVYNNTSRHGANAVSIYIKKR